MLIPSRARMMADKISSYDNLIDACLQTEEDPSLSGKPADQFAWIISEYFFLNERGASKNLELVIRTVPPPKFLSNTRSIFEISIDDLRTYVMGGSVGESLAGAIMLSQHYLKVFYPHHPPAFGKLPEDVRFELMDLIKARNEAVIAAFEKMLVDRSADRQRKILTLVALVLKKAHVKTEAPLNKLTMPAEDIIRSIFKNADEVFTASAGQIADLFDESKIKQLTKAFFVVKQFKDIAGIAFTFKEELERYRKRTISARP